MADHRSFKEKFAVSSADLHNLLRFKRNPERSTKNILILVNLLFTPITLLGAVTGYIRGYNRFMKHDNLPPDLYPLQPIMRVAMILGAIGIWVAIIAVIFGLYMFVPWGWISSGFIFYYFGINAFIGFWVFLLFSSWQNRTDKHLAEQSRFGSARFARNEELIDYMLVPGIYIGGGYTFSDKGHILTVAGTRGGKGTSLIIPNLLGMTEYKGSWVVIDPKGENAAITARYQASTGQNVVILNPWGLLAEYLPGAQSYNPLDILTDITNINLVDDAQVVAEMIVPIDKEDRDKFFSDNARAIVAGLLLHLVTSQDKEDCTLQKLWEWLRLPADRWEKLLEDMAVNDTPQFGRVVNQAAYEILKLMGAGDRTWGTIIAVALQCTDFIKSPALQESLKSGFDPKTLADGTTTLYVIIPADKLQSHARWLRLVTTTTMRAVVRNPKHQVCFLLDEFAALGYLPEIETALSTYAGFNITVWTILQSLIQLKSNYKDNWETFVGNSTIRQFFSVNDNFTADSVSKAIGNTTHMFTDNVNSHGEVKNQTNQRALVTPDELRRGSGRNIFAFMGDKPVTFFPKIPYYRIDVLYNNGAPRYDQNPYFK